VAEVTASVKAAPLGVNSAMSSTRPRDHLLTSDQRRDLSEIIEDRAQRRSTLVTSQLDTEVWHDAFGDPTLADAVLDRLVINAYRLDLEGESMRGKDCPPELEG